METKLRDFPCFYFTSAQGSRSEQKKYYATVAAMLGYSPKDASESSGYFIAISKGKLFNAQPFTEEELQSCGKIFESATTCSSNLARRFGVTKKVVANCCVLCPLSPSYANGRLYDEYIYLKGIIDNPEYMNQYPLEPSMLSSMHSLSLSDDVGIYPVIPFTSLLLGHLMSKQNLNPSTLNDELISVIKLHLGSFHEMDIALDSVIKNFVDATMKQILHSTSEHVEEQLLRTKHLELLTRYTYTPPRAVYPAATDEPKASRSERKRKISALSNQIGFEMFISHQDESAQNSGAEILKEETQNILQEQGKEQIEDVSFSDNGATEDVFWQFFNVPSPEEFVTDIPEQTEFEEKVVDSQKFEPASEASEISCTVCPANIEETISSTVTDEIVHAEETAETDYAEEYNTEIKEDVPEDIVFEEFTETNVSEISAGDTVIETENVLTAETDCDTVFTDESNTSFVTDIEIMEDPIAGDTNTPTEEELLYPEASGENIIPAPAVSIKEDGNSGAHSQKGKEPTELSVVSADPCTLCSIGASTAFFNNILRYAEPTVYAFFLRCMSKHPGTESFSSMKNRNGCALCPKKGNNVSCIYPSLSFRTHTSQDSKKDNAAMFPSFMSPVLVPRINSELLDYVIDCTDSQKINLIDFITEACNATEISVECVQCYGIIGLLFYVNGKFYFFDPAYGSSGFLKPLFHDATKTRFYSMNPIQVHACLYTMGFKRIRIESIAALFSTIHNLEVLAPIGIIFEGYMHRAVLDDMLARIMPYYSEVCNKLLERLNVDTRKKYYNGLRLELALGKNKDISRIARGHDHNVVGGNFLHYRVTMRHFEDLNEPGYLSVVKINNNELTPYDRKKVFESVAGKLASSTSRVHEHTYLVGLSSESIAYYSCYESDVFFDELMACVRSAYRDYHGGTPDISVDRTQFKF